MDTKFLNRAANVRNRNSDKSVVDFPVNIFPMRFADSSIESSVQGDRGVGIVRMDTQDVIARASSDYKLIPHVEILDAVESMFEANGLDYDLTDVRTGGKANARMYADYELPEHKIDIQGEEFTPFVRITNSYDLSVRFKLVSGLYRVWCSNGAIVTRSVMNTQFKHVGDRADVTKITLRVDKWIEELGIVRVNLNRLVDTPIKVEIVREDNGKRFLHVLKRHPVVNERPASQDILSRIFTTQKDRLAIVDSGILSNNLKETGENLYSVYNACTEYATHYMDKPDVCKNFQKADGVQERIGQVFELV